MNRRFDMLMVFILLLWFFVTWVLGDFNIEI